LASLALGSFNTIWRAYCTESSKKVFTTDLVGTAISKISFEARPYVIELENLPKYFL
jgi:hypothetical protein